MVEPRPQHMIGLPVPVRRAVWAFSALCVLCLAAEIVSRLKQLGLPYTWPLQSYYSPFGDFYFFAPNSAAFHTKAFIAVPFNYAAPMAVLMKCWYVMPAPLPMYLCSLLLGFLAAGILFARSLRKEGVSSFGVAVLSAAFAVSFPLWFCFERANTEANVWLVLWVGVWAFLRNRPYAAAVCIVIAGSLKLYPLLFLGLFFSRRQYKPVLFACLVGSAVVVLSLWLESGSVATSWYGTAAAAEPFRQVYILKEDSSGFDHSLFASLKQIAVGRVHYPGHPVLFAQMLRIYMPTFALIGLVLFFTRICKLPVLNQILALTVASILLTPVSFDYTLIHLYVPCALLVFAALRAAKRNITLPGVGAALLVMAVLLAPETEFILRGVTLSGDIKCMTLVLLFALALVCRFPLAEDQLRHPEPPSSTRLEVSPQGGPATASQHM